MNSFKYLVLTIFITLSLNNYSQAYNKQSYLTKYENEIASAEQYLNKIKTLSASFIQKSFDGTISKGTIYISRPGKMKVEYTQPSQLVILVNNSKVLFYDKELDELSKTSLESNSLALLTKKNINLRQDVEIYQIVKNKKILKVYIQDTNNTERHSLGLVFNLKPFGLVGIETIDPDNNKTLLDFHDLKLDIALSNKVFRLERNFLEKKSS